MAILKPGQELAGYQVVGFAGRGGMGEIYRARQVSIDREVALKILNPKLVDKDPRFAEQFKAEARAAGRLNHPNIIAVHDVGATEVDGIAIHYFSMEFVDGDNLKFRIDRDGALDLDLVGTVMRSMADALAYAARMSMVHRDIKPENLMMTTDGHLKLADFGLAMQVEEPDSGESAGLMSAAEPGKPEKKKVMGTPRYMSPEQARGKPLDHRSDQYSLGATLFHLLTGQPPYRHSDARSLMKAHVREPVPDPFDIKPVPEPWRRLCMRLMAKEPAERYDNPDSLIESVEQAILGQLRRSGSRQRAGTGRSRQRDSAGSSKQALMIMGGVGVVAVIGVVMALLSRGDTNERQRPAQTTTQTPEQVTIPEPPSQQPSQQPEAPETDTVLEDAQTLLTRLPQSDPARALGIIERRGLRRPYFSQSAAAIELLRTRANELRREIQAAETATRAPALETLASIDQLLTASRIGEADAALKAMPLEQQQTVQNEVAAMHRRVRQAIDGIQTEAVRVLATAPDAEAAQMVLTRAQEAGLPQARVANLQRLIDRRIADLNRAAAAEQEAARHAEQERWDQLASDLLACRGTLETTPTHSRFSSLAGRAATSAATDSQRDLLRALAGASSVARATEDAIRTLLRDNPPEAALELGGRKRDIRIVGLDESDFWIQVIGQAARMKTPVDDPDLSLSLPEVAAMAVENMGLDDPDIYVATYLWFLTRPEAGEWFTRDAEHQLSIAFNTIDPAMSTTGQKPPSTPDAQVSEAGDHGARFDPQALGDAAPLAFIGNGLTPNGSTLRWTAPEPVVISETLRDNQLPTISWRQPIRPGTSCSIQLHVQLGSRILVGLRRNGQAVRLGVDSGQTPRLAGILSRPDGGLTLNPNPFSFPTANEAMEITAILHTDGRLVFEVNGEEFRDQYRQPLSYTLPGDGDAELVFQSLDKQGNAVVDIASISVHANAD